VLSKATADLVDLGKVEAYPSFEGRVMSMVIAPLKSK
jgi:translation initiation factor IF-3